MAAGLMGVGLLGLSASSIMLSRSAKSADMTAAATALTTERLELIRSMPLGAPGHTPGNYNGGYYQPNGASGGPFNVSWVVSGNNTPTWGLRTVTVTTSWSQQGSAKNVRLAAFVRCSTTPCP